MSSIGANSARNTCRTRLREGAQNKKRIRMGLRKMRNCLNKRCCSYDKVKTNKVHASPFGDRVANVSLVLASES